MSRQLLIYNNAVPISRARHHDCSLVSSSHYGFSRGINSVPLTAVEFPQATAEYPIVFAGQPGEMTPVVILGLRADENLYLGPHDSWMARYIPAFIRRYPFVFSRADQRFLLCVDEEFPGFNREDRGLKFFGEHGEMSAFVRNVLNFVQEYQTQFNRTLNFCIKVEELGLLEPMEAQITMGQEKLRLSGFQAVSRAKLKALLPNKLAELLATVELELLCLHLQSMNNFEQLKDRMTVVRPKPASEREPLPEAAVMH